MQGNYELKEKRRAFTIVELLTVMAVIAILIGLLVPALNLVHDTAKDLQQKAQFHGIEVGLELYKSGFEEYPESVDDAVGGKSYTGSNKLAEAMVGFDLMGFHPKSEFTYDGVLPGGDELYKADTIQEREERFVDLEKANVFALGELYDTVPPHFDNGTIIGSPYVLCDNFAKRRAASGKKIGMPILYFRANTRSKIQDSANPADTVYDLMDNYTLLDLGQPEDGNIRHEFAEGGLVPDAQDYTDFDWAIINDQIQTADVPYRAQSFILMSAGKDGIFGNSDDVYNFDKEK